MQRSSSLVSARKASTVKERRKEIRKELEKYAVQHEVVTRLTLLFDVNIEKMRLILAASACMVTLQYLIAREQTCWYFDFSCEIEKSFSKRSFIFFVTVFHASFLKPPPLFFPRLACSTRLSRRNLSWTRFHSALTVLLVVCDTLNVRSY